MESFTNYLSKNQIGGKFNSKKKKKKNIISKKKKIKTVLKGGSNNRLPQNLRNAIKKNVEKFQQNGKNYRGKAEYKIVPDNGLIVWVFWKGENKWYKGKVIKKQELNKDKGFIIHYENEDIPVFHPYNTWKAYKWSFANLRQEQLHEARIAGEGQVNVSINIL